MASGGVSATSPSGSPVEASRLISAAIARDPSPPRAPGSGGPSRACPKGGLEEVDELLAALGIDDHELGRGLPVALDRADAEQRLAARARGHSGDRDAPARVVAPQAL